MLKKHLSLEECLFESLMNLCGSSIAPLLFFKQQSGNDHEIVCENCDSHQQFKSLSAFSKEALHAATAEEDGDASFNAGTESLGLLEGWAFLIGCLGRRFFPATLGNAYKFYTGVFTMLDIGLTEKSPVATVEFRSLTKRFLVTLQRGFDVDIVGWISIEHLILSDQTAGALGKVYFVAEFHWLQDFAPLDQVRVRLEYRKTVYAAPATTAAITAIYGQKETKMDCATF